MASVQPAAVSSETDFDTLEVLSRDERTRRRSNDDPRICGCRDILGLDTADGPNPCTALIECLLTGLALVARRRGRLQDVRAVFHDSCFLMHLLLAPSDLHLGGWEHVGRDASPARILVRDRLGDAGLVHSHGGSDRLQRSVLLLSSHWSAGGPTPHGDDRPAESPRVRPDDPHGPAHLGVLNATTLRRFRGSVIGG